MKNFQQSFLNNIKSIKKYNYSNGLYFELTSM